MAAIIGRQSGDNRAMAPNSHLTAAQQAPYGAVYPNYIPSFTPRYPHSPERIRQQQKHEKIKKYHFSLDTFLT